MPHQSIIPSGFAAIRRMKMAKKGLTGGRRRHRMRGGGFMDWIRKAHNWIRSNKVISRVGNALGAVGVPYAGLVGKAAGVVGYGKYRGRPRKVGRPRKAYHKRHVNPRTKKGGSYIAY